MKRSRCCSAHPTRLWCPNLAILELVWEIVQPHDDADHFSVAVRRKIGLVRLSADERNNRDLRLRVDEEVALFVYSEPPAPTPFASGWSSTELNHERNDG